MSMAAGQHISPRPSADGPAQRAPKNSHEQGEKREAKTTMGPSAPVPKIRVTP